MLFYMCTSNKRVARERVGPHNNEGKNLWTEPKEEVQVFIEYVAVIFAKQKGMDDDEIWERYVDIPGHGNSKKVLGVLLIIWGKWNGFVHKKVPTRKFDSVS